MPTVSYQATVLVQLTRSIKMDSKELALYHEEQRQALIDLNKSIIELHTILKQDKVNQVKLAESPTVSVSNQPDSVKVSNINEIEKSLTSLSDTLENAIKTNSYKPKDEIRVSNQLKELKINNLSELKSYFDNINQTIKNNQPIVEIIKQDIVWPSSANQAIPVRLSDGKTFYKAIVAAGGGAGTSFVDSDNRPAFVTIGSDGSIPVTASRDYDYIDVEQTSSTTDTYIFKSGGSGGSTVRTIVVVYTSSDKTDLDNVSWS